MEGCQTVIVTLDLPLHITVSVVIGVLELLFVFVSPQKHGVDHNLPVLVSMLCLNKLVTLELTVKAVLELQTAWIPN